MDRATARRLARALIAPADHTGHADERLEACLDLAIETYRAIAGPTTATTTIATISPTTQTDDTGDYLTATLTNPAAIAALAHPHADITDADGRRPRWRIETLTPTTATIRIYTDTLTAPLTIWSPAPAWPAAHTAAIAMLTASYYIQALALSETDPRRADTLSDAASTYYGRSLQLMRQ